MWARGRQLPREPGGLGWAEALGHRWKDREAQGGQGLGNAAGGAPLPSGQVRSKKRDSGGLVQEGLRFFRGTGGWAAGREGGGFRVAG